MVTHSSAYLCWKNDNCRFSALQRFSIDEFSNQFCNFGSHLIHLNFLFYRKTSSLAVYSKRICLCIIRSATFTRGTVTRCVLLESFETIIWNDENTDVPLSLARSRHIVNTDYNWMIWVKCVEEFLFIRFLNVFSVLFVPLVIFLYSCPNYLETEPSLKSLELR